MIKRKPVVAGSFYPSDPEEIKKLLKKITESELKTINTDLSEKSILGAVLPHAGYTYSAYQSVHFFEILRLSQQKFDTLVIINPNHTGRGKEIGLDLADKWETPFGDIEVDSDFAEATGLPRSQEAHQFEHAAEVILPMMTYFTDFDFKILPVSMGNQNYLNGKAIARNIYKSAEAQNKKIMFIASTDFSHHVTPQKAQRNDQRAIDAILKKDSRGLIETVKKYDISMCGYGPATALIEYSNYVNFKSKAKLLRYGHSGEVKKSDSVVGYASILFFED
ncbi:MAG: AmmeMemoRadiSam system protein B [Bacteroidota bacterium]|nr:AmmeMemoRadiSam system protein B [Bacteroidota bacterium]